MTYAPSRFQSHKRNIQRYTGLLATDITELEREYLHKQIAKEQAELERWTMQSVPDPLEETSNGIAAQILNKPDKEAHA